MMLEARRCSRRFARSRVSAAVKESFSGHALRIAARGVCATVLALCAVSPLQAQEVMEEIQVTGSRLSRTTMDTPIPVTVVTAEELSSMAPGNLIDGLSQMPLFYGNQNPEQVNGGQNSGGSNVNLRGAGTNRTLTLLDGRRVVPTNRFGTVDVNLFPEDLLRSVETVTGGASASYGTDAVAGVVNFLLNTDFVGVKTRAQTGVTRHGDGVVWEAGIAFGTEITDRLHLIGSVSKYDQDNISDFDALTDRPFIRQLARVTNPDPNGPTEIIRPYVSPTNFTNTGVIVAPDIPSLNRLVFQPDGTVEPMAFSGVGSLNTGCMCQAEPTQTYGVNSDAEIQNAYTRENLFLHLKYDVGDATSLYFQGIYSENSASDRRESISLLSGWQGRFYADNAYLNDEVRTLMADAGVASVAYGFFGHNRSGTPLGDSRQDTNNEMYSATFGFQTDFSGGFLDGWSLDGYYQYGENVQDFVTVNGVRVDRLQLAIDAVAHPLTGEPICRVNLPEFTGPIEAGGNGGVFHDCVPINTFGGVQNISAAGADYIMDRDNKIARQWTDQHVAEVVLRGDLWSGWGAGPIAAAFGVSYRQEELDQRTLDPSDEYPALLDGTLLSDIGLLPAGVRGLVPEGSTVIPSYSGIPGLRFVPAGYLGDANSSSVLFSSLREIAGGYQVREAFGELGIPILAGKRAAESLEISAAARWADYSGSGDIWAWKLGVNWALNPQLRLRATGSRDVRAATLRERFDQTRGGINVRNPWDNNNLVSAASLSGGNPNVAPEKADTYTAGIVFQPARVQAFSASLDWYSITIDDAIAQLTAQNIVDACRGGDLSMCQYVISGASAVTDPLSNTPRPIDRVESLFINLNSQRIRGMDFEMSYRTDLALFGGSGQSLYWRFLASQLAENSIQTAGSNFRDDRAGQIGGFGLPEYKITTNLMYRFARYSVFLQARWIDGGVLDRTFLESTAPIPASMRPAASNLALCNNGLNVCTIDDNSVPSTTYIDMRFAAMLGEREQWEVFLNVNNVLDRAPVFTPGPIGRTGVGLGVNTSLYDLLGRRFTAGVSFSF